MALYLLDTTAFSDLMRENRTVEQHVTTLAPTGQIFICPIVRGEVRYGLEKMPKGRRRRDFDEKAGKLFAALPCEPIPEEAGDHYGRLKRETERKGLTLD